MKKLLVVVLAVALILGFASVASAAVGEMGTLPNVTKIDSIFPDAKNETQVVKDATAKMYALGVINGLPNGSFAYDQTMTRGELAKITTYLTNYVASAQAMQTSASSYPDVKSNVWYTGWVNNVSTNGQMTGYPNGNFGPNNTVSVAELLTATLRALGYDDNLSGNWPYDYVAQAAKLGLTKNVDTNDVKRIATRRDMIQVISEVLNENLVVWNKSYNRFVPSGASAYRELDDEADYPFWSGWTQSYTWANANEANAAPMDLLEYAFSGRVALDEVLYNDLTSDDALNAWAVTHLNSGELSLVAYNYEDYEDGYAYVNNFDGYKKAEDAVLENYEALASKELGVFKDQYFISNDYTVFDLANMTADIIYVAEGSGVNATKKVLYIDVTSTAVCSDDLESSGKNLIVDEKTYKIADADDADAIQAVADDASYAKVYFDKKGKVYAVSDLAWWNQDMQGILSEVDTDDEILYFYDAVSPDDAKFAVEDEDFYEEDIEDEDVIVVKDNAFVRLADLKALDAVTLSVVKDTILEDYNDASLMLVAETLKSDKLTNADDETITIGDKDYIYGVGVDDGTDDERVEVGVTLVNLYSRISGEGGDDETSYENLSKYELLDDVVDSTVKYVTNRAGYQVAFLIHGEGSITTEVYGVVTGYNTVSSSSDRIADVTILNQEGKKVKYTVESDYRKLLLDGDILEGSYVEFELNKDGEITDAVNTSFTNPSVPSVVADLGTAAAVGDIITSGKNDQYIEIAGARYLMDDSTVIWNATFDSGANNAAGGFTDFDDAKIIKVADVKKAKGIIFASNTSGAYIVAETSKNDVLKRLYVINGSAARGTFDVIKGTSAKSSVTFLLAGKINTKLDDYNDYDGTDGNTFKNVIDAFVAYDLKDDKVNAINVVLQLKNGNYNVVAGEPLANDDTIDESIWVTDNRVATVSDNDATELLGTLDRQYKSGDSDVYIDGGYYDLSDDVEIIKVDKKGVMTKGSTSSSIKVNTDIMAIYNVDDEEVAYIFVIDSELADDMLGR